MSPFHRPESRRGGGHTCLGRDEGQPLPLMFHRLSVCLGFPSLGWSSVSPQVRVKYPNSKSPLLLRYSDGVSLVLGMIVLTSLWDDSF